MANLAHTVTGRSAGAFYGIKVRDYFLEAELPAESVKTIVMSSVVPGLTDKVRNVLRSLFKREPVLLGPGLYEKLPIEVLNPYEIGSDLVANAVRRIFF